MQETNINFAELVHGTLVEVKGAQLVNIRYTRTVAATITAPNVEPFDSVQFAYGPRVFSLNSVTQADEIALLMDKKSIAKNVSMVTLEATDFLRQVPETEDGDGNVIPAHEVAAQSWSFVGLLSRENAKEFVIADGELLQIREKYAPKRSVEQIMKDHADLQKLIASQPVA